MSLELAWKEGYRAGQTDQAERIAALEEVAQAAVRFIDWKRAVDDITQNFDTQRDVLDDHISRVNTSLEALESAVEAMPDELRDAWLRDRPVAG